MTARWRPKDWADIVRGMEAQGCEVKKTNSGMLVKTPCGDTFGLHVTESDYRAIKNTRARVRRAGLTWPLDDRDKHRKGRER